MCLLVINQPDFPPEPDLKQNRCQMKDDWKLITTVYRVKITRLINSSYHQHPWNLYHNTKFYRINEPEPAYLLTCHENTSELKKRRALIGLQATREHHLLIRLLFLLLLFLLLLLLLLLLSWMYSVITLECGRWRCLPACCTISGWKQDKLPLINFSQVGVFSYI